MPLPLAIILAIAFVMLWGCGMGLLLPVLMLGGMIFYIYRHVREEGQKNGEWKLHKGKLFGNLLGSVVLILIIFMFSGAKFDNYYILALFILMTAFFGFYAFAMALYKIESHFSDL